MAQPQSPWANLGNLMTPQAQALGQGPLVASATPEEQMASQTDIPSMTQEEVEDAVSSGQLDPKQPVRLMEQSPQAKKRTEMVQAMGPQSQEPVPQSLRSQDLVDQAQQQAAGAYAQQQQGIGQLEDNINQMRQKPQGGIDYTPFVSMAKFLAPESDAASMGAAAASLKPETPQQRAEKLINLQNMLQQRKEGLSKVSDSQLSALLKAQTQNSDLATQLKQSTIRKNDAVAGAFAARPALADRQIAERIHTGVLTKLANNSAAKTKLQAIQGIDNASSIIEDAPTVTPQIFHDYQQALVGAIQRGNSGIGERAERYMKSAGIDEATIQQYVTGQPVSIPKGKENALYKATQGFAKSERGNIEKQYGQVLDSVSSGQEHIYNKHPELKKDLTTALKNYKDMAASGSGKMPEIGEEIDGHVFKGGDPSKEENWEAK